MIRIARALLAWGLLVPVAAIPAAQDDAPKPVAPPAPKVREAYDVVFIGGKRSGTIVTKVEPLKDGQGRELVRVVVETRLTFKRLNDSVQVMLRFGTIESTDGSVLRLDSRTLTGASELRTFGDVIDGKMALTLDGGGRKETVTLDWPADVRGPYAAELSLAREPIAPGQTRAIKTFIPDLNKIGLTTLAAQEVESVELGGGAKRDLLRIEGVVTDAEGKPLPGMATTYWADDSGQILKSSTDVFGGLVTYRTTKAAASKPIAATLDLVKSGVVPVPRKIPNPEATRDVIYRVALKDKDANPQSIFPADGRQSIRPDPAGRGVLLEVRTAGPTAGAAGPEAVGPEFLAANPIVNSEDPTVKDLARRAVGKATDPWQKAVAIEQWVADNLKDKNFEVAFASAREVAQTLEGDCSEHSVLTAAMCRAAGVPSRVVVGLLYADYLNGFGYHMWNEVYVNRRWVAIDASFRQSDVDAVHIKLGDTSLEGVSPFETFLDVAKVFGKLGLEPIEIR